MIDARSPADRAPVADGAIDASRDAAHDGAMLPVDGAIDAAFDAAIADLAYADATAPILDESVVDLTVPLDATVVLDATMAIFDAATDDQAIPDDGGEAIDAAGFDASVVDLTAPIDLTMAPPFDAATALDATQFPVDLNYTGPQITVGAPDRILLVGTIVTPDQVIDGEVLIEGALITCVQPGTACEAAAGAAGATVIVTGGIIAPGMIDTHNHILFDIFDGDDWLPSKLYQDHNQWTAEPRYQAMLDVKQCLVNDSQGKPTWCANTIYGTAAGSLRCEVDKFGELKGLIAGTTSIVGLPGTSSACFGSLARSVDVAQNGLGVDAIQTSATFPPSKASADGVCANFASGKTAAYLIHCGEGIDAAALKEFATLSTVTTNPGCLLVSHTAITHGVAFGIAELTTMAQAGMKLTWSPASNVALYGQTADIPTALTAGVTVALAPDWSMGGSQNLLDELRFANGWDDAHWNNRLAPSDLVQMATANAAQALSLGNRIGRIEVGYLADLAVFAGDGNAPYAAILGDSPREVILTMVGGVALYGDAALVAAGPSVPGCETIDVCGRPKFLCVATTTNTSKLDQTYATIKGALEQALLDADAQTPNDGWNFAPLAPLVKCR